MKIAINTPAVGGRLHCKPVKRHSVCLASCLMRLFLIFGVMRAEAEWPRVVLSKDGTPISFEIYGAGEPTLIFVHGWSCDARYWCAQVPVFSKKYRVVLDLAGHGHSGMSRTKYTMGSFGEDVRAVKESTGSHRVILIGHSMGGSVIEESEPGHSGDRKTHAPTDAHRYL